MHSPSHGSVNNGTVIAKSSSPTKLKKTFTFTSSTNLDKVIEAVSKGLIDDHPNLSVEIKESRVELSPLIMPLVNGGQNNLNDSKVSIEEESVAAQIKVKPSKKVKKEKAKEKEVEKQKEKEIEKEKGREKVKEKEKEKEKDSKDKNKLREKLKRKTKDTTATKTTGLSSPETVAEPSFKDEKIKSNGKDITESIINHDTAKSDHKIIRNSPERPEVDTTIDSTNASALNASKDTKPTPETSMNGDAANVLNSSNDGAVEGTPTSTTTASQMSAERKLNRKHRKEKHRNKHGPDTERSSSKEHKKKRKRKNHDHDHENSDAFPSASKVPTIKIKVNQRPTTSNV